MSLSSFTFTDRARPIVQIGTGDTAVPSGQARWDRARWDREGDTWSGFEPVWSDVTCDVVSVSLDMGRPRITDRFTVGTANLIVDNASGWADPMDVPAPPQVLALRPGRPLRVGIVHDVLGTVWLFRGVIDALDPTYDASSPDQAQIGAVDVLGDANRAVLVPEETPVGANETADDRIRRVLSLVPVYAGQMRLDRTAVQLLADDLGGQVADLVGQAAESAGGSVFGDTNGQVVFRAMDWQTFAPEVPPDATIGNVGTGGPDVPAHLNPAVGTVSTPAPTDDPPGPVQASASPTAAASAYRVAGGTVTVGIDQAGTPFPDAVQFAQATAVRRADLVFPGVVGNLLTVPDAPDLAIVGDLTMVVDFTPSVWPPTNVAVLVGRMAGAQGAYQVYFNTGSSSPTFSQYDTTGTNRAITSSVGIPGMAAGVRTRLGVTRVGADVRFWTSTDGVTWTMLGAVRPLAASTFRAGAAAVTIGAQTSTTLPFAGRIHRATIAAGVGAGSTPGGTPALTVVQHDAGTLTDPTHFVATTGEVVTVVQTLTAPPIVQPIPNVVLWRFNASEFPGSGLSYTDPRGRTWTLSAPGAVVSAAPEVGADVCPTRWVRPMRRADIATRVLVGRDDQGATPVLQFDDPDGQVLYGVEPFERRDLLTVHDPDLTRIGQRYLTVRDADTIPRVASVNLDAATAPNALDLMTTASPFVPSRYRCRLRLDRGTVFDRQHYVTAVRHEITRDQWTAELSLDLAEPFAAAGGRWDRARWDRATWATPPAAALTGGP